MSQKKNIYSTGILWCLIGLISLFAPKWFLTQKDWPSFFLELTNQFGTALICLGVVAIIVQFEDWKKYFQERLKDIVIEKSYLESLSDEELAALQVSTLKAKYKETDIDREGSFLHYFQRKIQDYIGSYYREHVTCSLLIEEDDSESNYFRVYDDIKYTCRSIGDNIQDDVRWLYEHNEFEKVDRVQIAFLCPVVNKNDCDRLCKNNSNKKMCKGGKVTLTKEVLDSNHSADNEHVKGYSINIGSVSNPIDQLQIEISTSYLIKKDHFFTWAMTHPSKDVSFTITFPKKYSLNYFIGGVEPQEYSNNINGNMFTFKHEGWFLPRTGIAYNLVESPSE